MKKCSVCDKEKELKDFVKRSNRASGRQPYCKDCHNKRMRKGYCSRTMWEYDMKRNYGIGIKEYDIMMDAQNMSCAICMTHISKVSKGHKKHFCIDHDHETNKVRGLLCDSCNRALGLFKDDIDVLSSAIIYLDKHE